MIQGSSGEIILEGSPSQGIGIFIVFLMTFHQSLYFGTRTQAYCPQDQKYR
jgi:hypothetical protein